MKNFKNLVLLCTLFVPGILIGCSKKNTESSEKKYTYNISETSPQTFSPTDYQMSSEGTIIGLTGFGLYDFVMNKEKNGYEIICEMAEKFPEDVTAEYRGKYGVPENAKECWAWKFELNKNAVWEDGSPINSSTWEYSIQQFLNPAMKNYRASSFYQDTLSLANGEAYYEGKCEWEKVGFVKDDDYALTLILTKPVSKFFIEYNCSSPILVKSDLYEANKKQTGDIVKSAYGTSKETFASYGPYKIKKFQNDKEMLLEKNPLWYGWTDGLHENQYQTTDINIQFITEHSTLVSLFMQGKLDAVGLDSNDLKLYGNSEFRLTTPQSYTWKLTFNTDKASLKKGNEANVNHVLLAYKDFREAISFSVDRQRLVTSISPASEPGFGLINNLYFSDPEKGKIYRDCDYAKQALCEVYEASSIENITGYNKEKAKDLVLKAYNEALACGDVLPGDKLQIDVHTYSASGSIVQCLALLQDSMNEIIKDTVLEGRIYFNQVTDEDYYNNLKNGKVDCALTSWGGGSFDPYGVLWCYCDPEAINEYGFEPKKEKVTIEIDSKPVTKTFYDWYVALCNGEYVVSSYDTKNKILARVECELLKKFTMVPLWYANSSSLYSQKIQNGSDNYINSVVQYGGLRFMTYLMTDSEWASYCKKNNNNLKY